jgi:PAS domain S-box-containing protein
LGRFDADLGNGLRVFEREAGMSAPNSTEAITSSFDGDFWAALDTIPAVATCYLADGTPEFVSRNWRDYTGLTLNDFVGHRWGVAIHPDDMTKLISQWRAHLKTGQPFTIEHRLRRVDGEYRWFQFAAQPFPEGAGRIIRWYGIHTDIEDRKRADEAFRDSEQRFRAFNEATSDWYWETGPDHRFTYMPDERPFFDSIAAPTRIGLTRWEVAADLESEPEKWKAHIATLNAHKTFRDFLYRVLLSDDSMAYISVSGIPRYDAQGRFLGYRGGGTDVTSAVRSEHARKALRQAQAELAHVTRVTTLGELTASIAHEVNQPLTGAVGSSTACLRWLDKNPPRLDEVRASVEAIIHDCNRASEIIARIRALANKTDTRMNALDINSVVSESIELMSRELNNHGATLTQELASGIPPVVGDRVQLQQVIINLIINGIEATEKVPDEARTILVRSGRSLGDEAFVEIQDFGTGIDPEHIDKLFDAFFTTKPKGLGMGLSISRSIIEAHDGRLTVTTTGKMGTTIRIALPLQQKKRTGGIIESHPPRATISRRVTAEGRDE